MLLSAMLFKDCQFHRCSGCFRLAGAILSLLLKVTYVYNRHYIWQLYIHDWYDSTIQMVLYTFVVEAGAYLYSSWRTNFPVKHGPL